MSRAIVLPLATEAARFAAVQAVLAAPAEWFCRLAPPTRSLEQNALLHPLLDDIAKQVPWGGEWRSLQQWKVLTVSGHAVATGEAAALAFGLEGELVNLRESTAAMSKTRFASLVEYVLAWGGLNGVIFRTDR